jgi:hypothetical protein
MARKHTTDDDNERQEHEETAGAAREPDITTSGTPDPVAAETPEASGSSSAPTESELEAQGFTPDEVDRLIHISDRLARSEESSDAEKTLRRLRFARWLIERGVLDEWSA